MFRGVHAINLDAKGRLSVPTRYRDRLQLDSSGQLVVTIDTYPIVRIRQKKCQKK